LDAILCERIYPCEGIAIYVRGNLSLHALTPTPADIAVIVQRLNLGVADRIFANDDLPVLLGHSPTSAQAAGVLAVPLSRIPRD
jgi:light-regulated signal transduction histidine kinase (bacteriophytochrome)